MLAPVGDPEPRILQRKGTYVISFKEWSKIHCFLLKWHPLFTCLTCDDSSPLGSKRPALKTSASSQEAAITAKAGKGGERERQALHLSKLHPRSGLDGRDMGFQRGKD